MKKNTPVLTELMPVPGQILIAGWGGPNNFGPVKKTLMCKFVHGLDGKVTATETNTTNFSAFRH